MGDIRFASVDRGREIAFLELSASEGPPIVHFYTATAAMELLDEEPRYARLLRTLGMAGRLVLMDKPGIGASDPSTRIAITSNSSSRRTWLCSMRST